MKKTQFIIFLIIVNSVNLLINSYIWYQGFTALTSFPDFRISFSVLMVFLSFSYMAVKIFERRSKGPLVKSILTIGQVWMAAMAFLLFAFLLYDALRLLLYLTGGIISPGIFIRSGTHGAVVLIIFMVISITILAGMYNASRPKIKNFILRSEGKLLHPLKIVMASDIHLGMTIGKKRLDRLTELINSQNPDLILLPGDIFDEDLGVVIEENHGDGLKKLSAKYGVYAVPGNHEYFGNITKAVEYLQQHGIIVLRESLVEPLQNVLIVGRDDLTRKSVTGEARVPLKDILGEYDDTKLVIVMDHQPARLKESVENHVFLHLSGHTHHGQLFPFNLITKRIYEVSWGMQKKENTTIYVSCGVGTWGPPVRIGNTPEIVVFDIRP